MNGVATIDFNSDPFQSDYKQFYQQLHQSGCPFAHSSSGDHYAVGSHQGIVDVLKNHQVWKSKFGAGLNYDEFSEGVLINVDPPEHTQQVRFVTGAFSAAYFKSLQPAMQSYVQEQLDRIKPLGSADLHSELSVGLPMFVILAMTGLPRFDDTGEDRIPWLRQAVITGFGSMLLPSDEREKKIAEGWQEPQFTECFQRAISTFYQHVQTCKQQLASGEMQADSNVVCRFLSTENARGETLSEEKVLGFLLFLLTAGSATTTLMLSNIFYRLLSEPGVYQRLRDDPSLTENVIEETLRIDAPVHGLFRTNDEATALGPLAIDQDTKLLLLWGAAGLDPEQYDNPMAFDIDRDLSSIKRHLAFGYGSHFCRGAPLARLEADVALRTVMQSLPNLRLAKQPVKETRMPVMAGFRELWVEWG